jgi:hypothetical protein
MRPSSAERTRASSAGSCEAASAIVGSSFSEAPSSTRTPASSMSLVSFSMPVICASSDARLRVIVCAFF